MRSLSLSCRWHPVGHHLISGGNDQSIKCWVRHRPGDTEEDRYQGEPQRQQYGRAFSNQHQPWQQHNQQQQQQQQQPQHRPAAPPPPQQQLPGVGAVPSAPIGFMRGGTLAPGAPPHPPPGAPPPGLPGASTEMALLQQLLAQRPELGPELNRIFQLPPDQQKLEVDTLIRRITSGQ